MLSSNHYNHINYEQFCRFVPRASLSNGNLNKAHYTGWSYRNIVSPLTTNCSCEFGAKIKKFRFDINDPKKTVHDQVARQMGTRERPKTTQKANDRLRPRTTLRKLNNLKLVATLCSHSTTGSTLAFRCSMLDLIRCINRLNRRLPCSACVLFRSRVNPTSYHVQTA